MSDVREQLADRDPGFLSALNDLLDELDRRLPADAPAGDIERVADEMDRERADRHARERAGLEQAHQARMRAIRRRNKLLAAGLFACGLALSILVAFAVQAVTR